MAGENRRSRCAPAGRAVLPATRRTAVLAPASAARAAGRRPETQRHEVATPDPFDRSDSSSPVARPLTDTPPVPHQTTTVELLRSGLRDTQQCGIPHGPRAAQ